MNPTRTFDLLDRYLEKFPGKCALSAKKEGQWIEYSAEEYSRISHSFCYGLIELGFRKGDKIITISNNRPEWNFVDMGISMAGGVHVPVYTSLSSDEYAYILNHSDARMVIVSDSKLYRLIKPVCDNTANIEHLFTFDEVEGARLWTEVNRDPEQCSLSTLDRVRELKKEISTEDLASIIYTSGTTGTPKGVMLSHKNLVRNFLAAAEVFGLTPDDRFLSILPLCHVGGRLGNYQTQFSGATIFYAENMGTIAINLKEIKATGFDAVPRILEKIYDTVISKGRALTGFKKTLFFWAVKLGLRYRLPGPGSIFYSFKLKIADRLIFTKWRDALGGHVRLVGCGGASLQPRLERIFWAAGLKILNMYGLTETSPIITINRQYKELCRLGSVGALIDGVEMKIAPDGEILCRGHNVMMGYYKDDELTRSVIDDEGWFSTGDVGRVEDNKFLYVTDRKKEIFKLTSGKYIAPQVIENKIKESPYVDQVMVIGEHQKFASSLIVPDFASLRELIKSEGIADTGDTGELINAPRVKEIFSCEIDKINRRLAEHERILRFRLVNDVWSPATGELSASLKLKRRVVETKYSDLVNSIYMK